VLFLVVVYMIVAVGLNVVIGLAGLLDLGYVGFYALGAYSVALFGSPSSPVVEGSSPASGCRRSGRSRSRSASRSRS
jgi:branched-chain amino acid transport system permease protein